MWHPGFWAQDNAFCDKLGALKPYTLLDDTFTMASVPSDPCEIRNDLYQNRELLGLLLGSRSGFQNPLAFQKVNPKLWSNLIVPDTASAQRVSAVFPINFDVNAFQEALADNTSGELGWIIQNIIPEGTFNGIVYIASSWPGIHDDFVDASTKAHPQLNPLGYEENSTAPTSTLFPYPLCGATERSLPTGGTPPKINRCGAATEQQTAISATNPTHIFPNALRIINGRNLRNDHRSVEANEYLPELSNLPK